MLRGVSIRVNPGERVALVGASGSGKSTLTKLLLRQYGCTSGSVLLDGVDVRDIPQADLARRVASVEQDPALFSGSIRDNVRFGLAEDDERASDERVAKACASAGLEEVASRLPQGLETPAGAAGTGYLPAIGLVAFLGAVSCGSSLVVRPTDSTSNPSGSLAATEPYCAHPQKKKI